MEKDRKEFSDRSRVRQGKGAFEDVLGSENGNDVWTQGSGGWVGAGAALGSKDLVLEDLVCWTRFELCPEGDQRVLPAHHFKLRKITWAEG